MGFNADDPPQSNFVLDAREADDEYMVCDYNYKSYHPLPGVSSYPDIQPGKAIHTQNDFLEHMSGKLETGDIIFQQSNSKAGRWIRNISQWTHVAVYLEYNYKNQRHLSLESLSNGGVMVRNMNENQYQDPAFAWSAKRVEHYSVPSDVYSKKQMVREANNNYGGKPFLPSKSIEDTIISAFVKETHDKYNNDSYYCSKLAWAVYKDYIDLDSNRTVGTPDQYTEETTDDRGNTVRAWIGVSPDDLYYSKHMSYDLGYMGYLQGLKQNWWTGLDQEKIRIAEKK